MAEDKAEVIILAGAALCGYAEELTNKLGVPVLDPVVIGLKMAEMMVQTGLCQSKVRKFAAPPQPIKNYF